MIPYGDPKAYVERDLFSDCVKIHLATRTADGSFHVLHDDGAIRTYSRDEAATYEPMAQPFLRLPTELAYALLDALAAHFGGVSEVRQLRKDYEHERARVDRLIAHITTATAGERH